MDALADAAPTLDWLHAVLGLLAVLLAPVVRAWLERRAAAEKAQGQSSQLLDVAALLVRRVETMAEGHDKAAIKAEATKLGLEPLLSKIVEANTAPSASPAKP